ncbi:MAG: FAD-dependent oxidoreductase [Pseudomonadota bacterium]
MTEISRIVIIGGGQAALQLAVSLRAKRFAGSVTLIGDEAYLPYMRPPLSKGFLKGHTQAQDLAFRPAAFYVEEDISLALCKRATFVDRVAKSVVLTSGEMIPYDVLVFATGARVRRLQCSGSDLDGVMYLRNLDDACALHEKLRDADKIIVIGGGFIGLEVAAIAAKDGKKVKVLEASDRLMGRAVSRDISEWFLTLHKQHGVDIELGSGIKEIRGQNGRVSTVRLVTGSEWEADAIAVGIGVIPNSDIASDCGLIVNDGIVVNENPQTSDPNIYAIGDCARFPCALNNELTRLESVQNAVDQAKLLADSIVDGRRPYKCVPWFWTEQYDVKFQMAGLSSGHDEKRIVGDLSSSAFSIEYAKAGRLIAVDSINRPADHLRARRKLADELIASSRSQFSSA